MVKVLQQPLATLPVSVSSVYVLERRSGNGQRNVIDPCSPWTSKDRNRITPEQSFYSSAILFCFVVISCIIQFKIHICILIQLTITTIFWNYNIGITTIIFVSYVADFPYALLFSLTSCVL